MNTLPIALTTSWNTDTTADTIHTFLQELSEYFNLHCPAEQNERTHLVIHTQPVCYSSNKVKREQTTQHDEETNALNNLCCTIGSAKRVARKSGTIWLFWCRIGPSPTDPAADNWHMSVVYYKGDTLWIYNPNDNNLGPNPRLKDHRGVHLIQEFQAKMRKNDRAPRTIRRMYMGGGGNVQGNKCQEMCREFMVRRIALEHGARLESIPKEDGWASVRW